MTCPENEHRATARKLKVEGSKLKHFALNLER
nr:MAG TPA: hypothetical protein [Caudoviricetes sp.]DAP32747.1 MAG TPA: hypothetical protein [Caudoviricetes sp.]